ncbi:low molecular weight protein-tyrosine-phosphatase [Niveibacterium terrae]|uniref:low molecular weight protein-tyrosine-phosphatase n=1 Tax=Niveibacterium terrae TaxID=3373598 RepID=UPI003A8EA9F2
MAEKIAILFVCTGNICRSPTAEGVLAALARDAGIAIEWDSAGISGCHVGEAPDPRAQKAAARRGYDLSQLRARKLEGADFRRFDLILAMDRGHLDEMKRRCPEALQDRVHLFLDYLPGREGGEIPDPYYGGEAGFEHVLDLCEDAGAALLRRLTQR